jgi:hypothetical protein
LRERRKQVGKSGGGGGQKKKRNEKVINVCEVEM